MKGKNVAYHWGFLSWIFLYREQPHKCCEKTKKYRQKWKKKKHEKRMEKRRIKKNIRSLPILPGLCYRPGTTPLLLAFCAVLFLLQNTKAGAETLKKKGMV